MEPLMTLLLAFALKHFLADFILQGPYMLGKFKDNGWFMPLSAHAFTHAIFTFIIAVTFVPWHFAVMLALGDLFVHFGVDRWKVVSSKGIGTDDATFWHYLGFDQLLHRMTDYAIFAVIVYLMIKDIP